MATDKQKVNGGEIVPVPREAPLAATPVELLRIAVTQGASIDQLEKLMGLQERWEKNEARKAFVSAMNRFKANPPTITKNKQVSFDTKSGGRTEYRHATLDHVCDEINGGLSAVGIAHSWKVRQDNGVISVACVLTHELGHSEEVVMMGAPDTSGTKNSIQAIASTTTYLQRYTLLAACGLAAANDTDGSTFCGTGVDPAKIEEYCRQINDVENLEDLKAVFSKAYGEAQALNDRSAMANYIQAKDAKKKELANANR